ncbi:MAG TPA: cytochrome c [Chthoniobacterales bacterium]|nr:cytochrome c [Chthoniobacterales bacterium]
MNEQTPDRSLAARQGTDYGETSDVQDVHAAIQREKREPRVGLEPLSIWLIAVYGLAVFWGGIYLGRYWGNFSGDGLDPLGGPPPTKKAGAVGPGGGGEQAELSPVERGKKVFLANCAVCHQANGQGSASQSYPPLAGSEFTTGGSRRPAMIVLKGLQGPVTVKGQKFGSAVMQPWETLGEQKVADVLTYERSEWGNNASPVTKEQIAALRKELASHPASFTEPDIMAVPADAELSGGAAAPQKPGEAAKPGANPPPPAPPKT